MGGWNNENEKKKRKEGRKEGGKDVGMKMKK
jgi:hypothetical protein